MRLFALIGLILTTGALAALLQSATTYADSSGWLSADPDLVEYRELSEGIDNPEYTRHKCTFQDTKVARAGYPGQLEDLRLCVSRGNSFRFAQQIEYGHSYISIGSDRNFYQLDVSPGYAYLYHLVDTDTVILAAHAANTGKTLTSYDDFHKRLSMRLDRQYEFVDRNTDSKLTGGVAGQFAYGWGVSSNGKYFVYGRSPNVNQNSDVNYFVLVDTETKQRKLFGKGFYIHYHRPGEPPEFVISDDGRTVIATGYGILKFWNITPECLIDVPEILAYAPDPCEHKIYYPDFYGEESRYPASSGLIVSQDFETIQYNYKPESWSTSYLVVLRMPGSVPVEQLDYLALGDSYSSGEGDVEDGSRYYLPGTGGDGECHLSSRSYPFQLRRLWGINDSAMRSVACSGARVAHDYMSSPANYLGQDNRLADRSTWEQDTAKEMAIDTFNPGILPQLEFVKKYKPKVVTLTGGGNDVGFAEVLRDCASTSLKNALLPIGTCTFASHQDTYDLLVGSIRNQYGITKLLISKIRQASPETRIYVIGYPQFIKRSVKTCLYNDAFLNVYERETIRDLTTELNNVLWRAATDSGVAFIDIEDSLEGGQLCGGGKYMTGVHKLAFWSDFGEFDQRSLFHPNASGHIQIAQTIFSVVPSMSSITGSISRPGALSGDFYREVPYYRQQKMIDDMLPLHSGTSIVTESHTFRPGSEVRATMYSDPVNLGVFSASHDGALREDIALPEGVGMGYHTLIVEGISTSGEPVTLYQFVTVTSGIEGDIDGDGIPDTEDYCMFITEWYDEQTGWNVCKGIPSAASGTEEGMINQHHPLPAPEYDLNAPAVAPSRIAVSNEHSVSSGNDRSQDTVKDMSGDHEHRVRISADSSLDSLDLGGDDNRLRSGLKWLVVTILAVCLIVVIVVTIFIKRREL